MFSGGKLLSPRDTGSPQVKPVRAGIHADATTSVHGCAKQMQNSGPRGSSIWGLSDPAGVGHDGLHISTPLCPHALARGHLLPLLPVGWPHGLLWPQYEVQVMLRDGIAALGLDPRRPVCFPLSS